MKLRNSFKTADGFIVYLHNKMNITVLSMIICNFIHSY